VNRGTALTIIANLIWGFAALYWIETQPIGPVDLLAHRALWSVPVLVACLLWMGRLCGALAIFTRPGALGLMAASATTQAANWGIFLWAVTSGRATEASLGYFLLPLLNIAFGIYLFGEQIGRAQRIAISLAGLGMLILIAENRGLPWAALGVAVSFGLYGVIRKKVTVGAIEGLFVETLLMAPLALLWLLNNQWGGLGEYGLRVDLFLLGAGVMTVVPLACYVVAARMLPLTSLGLIYYLGPSCQLFVAVCIFGESLNPLQLFSFVLVWLGLAFVVADTLRRYRSVRALPND
jgi:chloramphenicol-sensitive protein RarD